jgi:hypothetical protein
VLYEKKKWGEEKNGDKISSHETMAVFHSADAPVHAQTAHVGQRCSGAVDCTVMQREPRNFKQGGAEQPPGHVIKRSVRCQWCHGFDEAADERTG